MKFKLLSFLILVPFCVFAQSPIQFVFKPKFKSENLELNKAYYFAGDTLKISNFKCYVSNIAYYNNDTLVYMSDTKAHLIDAANSGTFTISEKKYFKFDKIKFSIGIDSLTNVSGIYEGDLDPANGMYWTWQSGYINLKVEGSSSRCPALKNKFYWHIGGYTEPFYTLRKTELQTIENDPLEISIQLAVLFEKIDISTLYHVMSPNAKAVQIADNLPSIFKIDH